MGSIRRYGPSLVTPEVSPRPELGQGREKTLEAFGGMLKGANDFIRPAVEQIQTVKGEQEALGNVEETGPRWGLRNVATGETTGTFGAAPAEGAEAAPATLPRALQPGPTRIRAALIRSANQYGVDAGVLSVIVDLESSWDPNAKNSRSSAGGLFQVIDGTAADYGLENRFDIDQSADTGARITRDNISRVSVALGRDLSVGEIYLAHQQGGQGAINLLTARSGTLAANVVGHDAVALNGGNPATMTAQEFAGLWIDKANNRAAQMGVTVGAPNNPEYELETINNSTFEARLPFTVRDVAFNTAADRVIGARAATALEEGMRAATQRADGDLSKLSEELEAVRSQVMGDLPPDLPGLATDLQESFDRGSMVAQRQAIELGQRRIYQQQEEALSQATSATRNEAERLALTGATGAELAAHMAQATDNLARFGPREEFTVAGKVYPADPSRAGIMSAATIGATMAEATSGASKLMIEADFARSSSPGQYVDEFRRQVFAGNSPLPAGESLEMLRTLEARARATDSAKRTAAAAERQRLEQGMSETINAYVSLGDAGVPVAIPAEERTRILGTLSAHPDLQRKALIEFAVADAQVQTHGMSGGQLMGYVGRVQEDIQAAADRGELDLAGAAVIESLQDRIKQVQDAVSTETVGLPLIEQLAQNGGDFESVDYDALRESANGNQDVIASINEVEAFHRDIESLSGLSASERDAVLEDANRYLTGLAAQGQDFGIEALTTQRVVERLGEWTEHRKSMATNEPLKFAASVGVDLPTFAGIETMDQAGIVLAERIARLSPHTSAEGVENPVPMSQSEIDALSEVFQGSSRGQRAAFLGAISDLGEDQAMAVFSRMGQSEPVIYAAGAVYTMGNQAAAGVILRGANDVKLDGGGSADVAAAREGAIGNLIESDVISTENMEDIDRTAMAYARGKAFSRGADRINGNDISEGYQIAMGRQADGTGGAADTNYGATILPKGWDERRINRAIGRMTNEQLTQVAKGFVMDSGNNVYDVDTLERSIEGLRPSPEDPNILVPVDMNGGVFLTQDGATQGILQFDLRELGEWQE